MSVAAKTRESTSDAEDLYRIRDELAENYKPANAFERMLLSQAAQSWLRLQRAQDAERRYFQTHDVLDAIATDFKTYQAITRLVAECDRAWRSAKWNLEKAQSTRRRTDTSSPNARRRPIQPPPSSNSATTTVPYQTPPAPDETSQSDPPVKMPSG